MVTRQNKVQTLTLAFKRLRHTLWESNSIFSCFTFSYQFIKETVFKINWQKNLIGCKKQQHKILLENMGKKVASTNLTFTLLNQCRVKGHSASESFSYNKVISACWAHLQQKHSLWQIHSFYLVFTSKARCTTVLVILTFSWLIHAVKDWNTRTFQMCLFPAADCEVQSYIVQTCQTAAVKELTCRYPAGLPLEKGVGNYIAFRLIRHSCQI